MTSDNARSIATALSSKRGQYESAFVLLTKDFLRVCESVEPVDAHLAVFSHRLYELLLRACTEFESLSREILTVQSRPRIHLTVKDFARIAAPLALAKQRAILAFWRPEPARLVPFENWSGARPSLSWYQDYNSVKHNRNLAFAKANMRSARDAMTAVFILLARLEFLEVGVSVFESPGSTWQGTTRYRDVPFLLEYDHWPSSGQATTESPDAAQ